MNALHSVYHNLDKTSTIDSCKLDAASLGAVLILVVHFACFLALGLPLS